MSKQLVLIVFFSLLVNSVVCQQIPEIVKLEQKADSLYFDLVTTRDEDSFLKEKTLRGKVLSLYTEKESDAYKTSLAKKLASEALFLMDAQNQFESAIISSKKAIQLLEEVDKPDLVLKGYVYRFLYHQYAYSGDWKTAYPLTIETREIFMDTLVENHKLVADVEFDIGYAAAQFGDIDTVIRQWELAKDKYISFQGKNTFDVGLKYQHLAHTYGDIGYYKKELFCRREGIEILEAIDYKDRSYLAISYGNLSAWYLQHGDIEKAEQYHIKQVKFVEEHKKDGVQWYNETFLGRTKINLKRAQASILIGKKDTVGALRIIDENLTFLNGIDTKDRKNNPYNRDQKTINSMVKYRTIVALRLKADLLASSHPEEALELHKQALRIRGDNGLSEAPLPSVKFLANYYIREKKFEMASAIIENLIIDMKTYNDYYLMQLIEKQAEIAFFQDAIPLMKSKYQEVFKKLQKDTLKQIPLEQLNYIQCKPYGNSTTIGITLNASKKYLEVYKQNHKDIDLKIAYNLSVLASDMFRVNNKDIIYNDKNYGLLEYINEQVLQTTLAKGDEANLSEVISKIEGAKSHYSWRAFMDSKVKKNLKIPDTILDLEQELIAQRHYYKKSLFIDAPDDEEKIKTWQTNLLDAERAMDTLNDWYQEQYPQYLGLFQKKFDPRTIQKALTKRQKVINYVFAKTTVYAFSITKEDIQITEIGAVADISKDIKTLLKALEIRTSKAYVDPAKALYQKLLARLVTEDDKELIFIRDGVMQYLPLEVLIDEKDAFLLRNHAVSYASSVHLWDEQVKVKKHRRNKMGIFAPIYTKDTLKNPNRSSTSHLQGAVVEAEALSKLFESDLYRHETSGKDVFLTNAQDYQILHLAMHAELNNVNAEFSNLNFSSNEESEKLFVSELYGVSINADLAVLSACNTGVGNYKKGEGLMNISRAFTYSGVPSLVASQWRVPDNTTAGIMVSFYTNLKNGMAKNEALQQAKLSYLDTTDDELLKHPYYWAGFVVSGNISPIEDPVSRWWLLLIPVGALGVFIFKKRNLLKSVE